MLLLKPGSTIDSYPNKMKRNRLRLLKEQGMEVTELTNEQKSEFKQSMGEIYQDIEAEVGPEFFDRADRKRSVCKYK